MVAYVGCHVWHAALTHFYSDPVEELTVAIVLRQMSVDQADELFGHISG